jgi:nucleoid-associated protein YgaU
MTRESKLALVLGFSLMLFVLILVSDHMAARNAPVVASHIDKRPDVGVPPLPVPGTGGTFVLQGDDGAKALPVEPPAIVNGIRGGGGENPDNSRNNMPGGTRLTAGPQSGSGPGVPQPRLPEAPSIKTYTIKSGDTFAAIASREYKKRSLGEKLAAYNGIDPSRMKVGAIVKLPPVNELDPSLPATRLASNERGGESGGQDVPNPSQPVYRVYKVKNGDTLYGIAERELGGPGRLRELRSANNELLRGSDDLRPGMQIRIPERSSALTSATTDA